MTSPRPAAVIVLAAGEGTRMRSAIPKVLHEMGGRSLLGHALAAARGLEPEHLVVVVRHERALVAAHVAQVAPDALVADQDEIKGTGRATECGLAVLPPGWSGTVLVTYGDVPLLTADTLAGLVRAHHGAGAAATVVTARVPDPTGYGRIVRAADGSVAGIVEQKDATPEQARIDEINSGIYAFDGATLMRALSRVGTDNAQGERYLTDVLSIAREDGGTVQAHPLDDLWQTEGVNDRVQLARLGAELNRRTVERWMREGVTIVDPATTWIDAEVTIGRDSVLRPGCQLLGATTVGPGVVLGPDCTLTSCEVDAGAHVARTDAELAVVRGGARVGPFVHLRPGAFVAAGEVVGAFTEVAAEPDPDDGTPGQAEETGGAR